MIDKLKIISSTSSWESQEEAWEDKANHFKKTHPLKSLASLPKMAGITPKTAKFLKWKSLFYILRYDKNKIFLRYFFKRPFSYAISLISSYFNPKSFTRQGDFFYYGIKDEEEFKKCLAEKEAIILIGFSYCHKPMECPSGRFSDKCQNNPESPVCSQCFIGKCSSLTSETKAKTVYIPTIHYIGEKIFEATHNNPGKPVFFLITACEMSLTMFGDWGNMIKARGIGVRLDGRICNTMKAFKLSEEGIKPGLTVVLDATQEKMLELMKHIRKDAYVEKV